MPASDGAVAALDRPGIEFRTRSPEDVVDEIASVPAPQVTFRPGAWLLEGQYIGLEEVDLYVLSLRRIGSVIYAFIANIIIDDAWNGCHNIRNRCV